MVFVFHEKKMGLWCSREVHGVGMIETCKESGFELHYCNMGNRLVAFFGVLALGNIWNRFVATLNTWRSFANEDHHKPFFFFLIFLHILISE